MVAVVRLVEPAPVVAHEVSQAAVTIRRVLKERDRAVDDRRPHLLVFPAGELERDDGEAGHVVDAVAALAVRDDAVGVLDDPDVVDEREQMIGTQAHVLEVDPDHRPAPARCERDRLAEDGRSRRGDGRPGELLTDSSRLGAGRSECGRLLDVLADGVRQRGRVGERHERARARGEHVLRVPVRRRDDTAAGREPERQRAGRDLLLRPVRRHEDVGCRQQVGDLLDAQIAVVELHVTLETEVEHRPLEHQPVALALAVGDVRMCPPRDHVQHLRVPLDDRRQRLDHGLEALSCGDQAEG